jgi:hypothetical protein
MQGRFETVKCGVVELFLFLFFFCLPKFGYFVPNSRAKALMILSSPYKAFTGSFASKARSY